MAFSRIALLLTFVTLTSYQVNACSVIKQGILFTFGTVKFYSTELLPNQHHSQVDITPAEGNLVSGVQVTACSSERSTVMVNYMDQTHTVHFNRMPIASSEESVGVTFRIEAFYLESVLNHPKLETCTIGVTNGVD